MSCCQILLVASKVLQPNFDDRSFNPKSLITCRLTCFVPSIDTIHFLGQEFVALFGRISSMLVQLQLARMA